MPSYNSRRRLFRQVADDVDRVRMELRDLELEEGKLKAERERLVQRIREVDTQVAGLGAERRFLVGTLAALEEAASGVPALDLFPSGFPDGVPQSEMVFAVVAYADGAPVTPAQVRDVLEGAGLDVSASSVRVALRRWVDRGRLVHDERGYRLPARERMLIHGRGVED